MKQVNSLEWSKKVGKVAVLIGFVMGLIYSFGGLVIDVLVTLELLTSTETPGISIGTILAFGAILGMPVIVGGFGFGLSYLVTTINNLIVKARNE